MLGTFLHINLLTISIPIFVLVTYVLSTVSSLSMLFPLFLKFN